MDEILVSGGCLTCGEPCPYTDETDPPITPERLNMWLEGHRRDCPGYPDAQGVYSVGENEQ